VMPAEHRRPRTTFASVNPTRVLRFPRDPPAKGTRASGLNTVKVAIVEPM